MTLLIKRARLIASAANKLKALDDLIRSLPYPPSKAIFYCGDGRVTDTVGEDDVRQIQAVAKLLGEKHGLRVRSFTYEESANERERILAELDRGELDGVVAIRCLDEGIDLPDLRQAFLLASSTNPRQFIQRRGRILRRAAGKERAEIFDLIVTPPPPSDSSDAASFNVERSLFRRELSRIVEFAGKAANGPQALAALLDLRKRYNLLGDPDLVAAKRQPSASAT
jgi:superfamily II DNA or RNA helicase